MDLVCEAMVAGREVAGRGGEGGYGGGGAGDRGVWGWDAYAGEDAVSCVREQDEECSVGCKVEECSGAGGPYAVEERGEDGSGDRKH